MANPACVYLVDYTKGCRNSGASAPYFRVSDRSIGGTNYTKGAEGVADSQITEGTDGRNGT